MKTDYDVVHNKGAGACREVDGNDGLGWQCYTRGVSTNLSLSNLWEGKVLLKEELKNTRKSEFLESTLEVVKG